jgi:hypothetical protein
MSNYTEPQFHEYRSKSTEELIKLLQSDSTAVVYKSLVVLESRKIVSEETFGLLEEISENGKTFKNRKMACILVRRFFSTRSRGLTAGESKVIGYVYFIQHQKSGLVKIGRTKHLERRVAIFTKRFQSSIKLIHSIQTLNYEKIELAFHRYFCSKRKMGEWFALGEADIDKIKQNMFPKEIQNLIPDKKPSIQGSNWTE